MEKLRIALPIIILSMILSAPARSSTSIDNHNYKGEISCPEEIKLKDKLYIGVGVGYDSYRLLDKTTLINDGTSDKEVFNPYLNATGLIANIFLGYGFYFDKFFHTY